MATPREVYNNFLNTYITGSDVTISFSSSFTIFETQYNCTIGADEYNYSNNPTLLTGSEGFVYDFVTGSYFAPYVTTVGLYDDNHNLLAVAKLAKPLPTSKITDTNIIINIDR